MRTILALLLLAVAGPGASCLAADAPTGKTVFTLAQCLAKVKAENPAIRAIRFNIEAMDRRAKSVRALYLPQITANGEAGSVNGEPVGYFSVLGVRNPTDGFRRIPGIQEYQSGGGELYMPLINDGSYFGINTPPAEKIQLMNKEIVRDTGELTLQQILFNVTKTYLEVVGSKHKLDLLERQKKLSEKQLAIEKSSFKYGLATQADVDTAQLVAVQNANACEAAANLATESFLRMALMLGVDDPQSFAIEVAYPPMPKLPEYSALIAMIQEDHPALQKQAAVVEQARAQLALDQNKIWPTVNLRSDYTFADQLDRGGAHEWTTFVTVNVPVFDFGILHNQARSDLAAVEAQNLQLQQSRDDLRQSLYDAYIAIRDNTYAAAAINSRVAATRQALEKIEVLQQSESAPMMQAITTEQSFLTARLEQEDVTAQHILSYANLQQVVAGRWNWLSQPPAVSAGVTSAVTQNVRVPALP